jgi:hypothetical protein
VKKMTDNGFDAASLEKARETFRKFSSFAPPPNIFQVSDSVLSKRSDFPVQLGTTDPEDDKFAVRKQLVTGPHGEVPGQGVAQVGEDYFNYMERKREQANMFEFMKYILSQADLSKPESADWWFRKFPWMQSLRLNEITRQSEIQKKLATIQITGPQSEDDFMLLFMKEKELLGDVKTPVQELNTRKLDSQSKNSFVPGMFSFFSTPDRMFLGGPTKPLVDWANPIGAFQNFPATTQGQTRNIPTGLSGNNNALKFASLVG